MNDYAVSLIRTWVPILVGGAAVWLGREHGIVIDEDIQAETIVPITGLVIGAYYSVVRWVETKKVKAGVLLGRAATPTYDKAA